MADNDKSRGKDSRAGRAAAAMSGGAAAARATFGAASAVGNMVSSRLPSMGSSNSSAPGPPPPKRRQRRGALAPQTEEFDMHDAGEKQTPVNERMYTYLQGLMPTERHVKDFLIGDTEDHCIFSKELGWAHTNRKRTPRKSDLSIASRTRFPSFEADGSRRLINGRDRLCRVHAYGSSFSSGFQVNDGQTWQEYLAASLDEPIRNYGVAGYSVYQSYLRMLQVEKSTEARGGAKYIILTIGDDDHYRNLDAWQSIRSGIMGSTKIQFCQPHLRVNVSNGSCEEHANICQESEEVYQLCNTEWVRETFKDDPVLKMVVALRDGKIQEIAQLPTHMTKVFGIPEAARKSKAQLSSKRIRQMHGQAAFFATQYVVHAAEIFADEVDKTLLVVLSFSRTEIARELAGQDAADKTLTQWFKDSHIQVVDLRDAFRAQYQKSHWIPGNVGDIDAFLDDYYLPACDAHAGGGLSPLGNFFCASALRDQLLALIARTDDA